MASREKPPGAELEQLDLQIVEGPAFPQ